HAKSCQRLSPFRNGGNGPRVRPCQAATRWQADQAVEALLAVRGTAEDVGEWGEEIGAKGRARVRSGVSGGVGCGVGNGYCDGEVRRHETARRSRGVPSPDGANGEPSVTKHARRRQGIMTRMVT